MVEHIQSQLRLAQTQLIEVTKIVDDLIKVPDKRVIISEIALDSAIDDVYASIRAILGTNSIEAPDLWQANHPGENHILRLQGGPAGSFLRFLIHPQDGDKQNGGGRSRNEIKGHPAAPPIGSPDGVKAFEGDMMRFRWYFQIPAEYSKGGDVTSDHIFHQLHNTEVGPIVKMELRQGELSFKHDPDNENIREVVLASTPVSPLLGQWLEVEETATFLNDGFLALTVKDETGKIVMSFEEQGIDMWTGEMTRPKWGIYRGREDGYNDQDWVDFSGISIQKLVWQS